MDKKVTMSVVLPLSKRQALKAYCELYSMSFNALCNGLLDKFMESKKFTTKPKKVKVKKEPKEKKEKKVKKKKVVKKKAAKKKAAKK